MVSEPKMETPEDDTQGDRPPCRDENEANDDDDDEQTGTTIRENVKDPAVHDNGGMLEDSRATAASNTPLTKMDRGHDAELGVSNLGNPAKSKRNSVHR